jgi:hypothetical protein
VLMVVLVGKCVVVLVVIGHRAASVTSRRAMRDLRKT